MNLKGKTAVITGASSGLGQAVAAQLAAENVKVFALARSIAKAKLPDTIIKIPCNIRDLNSIDQAFAIIDEKTSSIDFLINCAGRALVKPFSQTTRDEIMDVLGVNLKGNMYIAQEVYKRMIPKKSGHIINVSSTSGLRARDKEVVYAASKWGLRGFTESLRLEARQHGIRVTGVYPGGMKSENFWRVASETDITEFMDPAHVAEQILNIIKSNPGVALSELVIERP